MRTQLGFCLFVLLFAANLRAETLDEVEKKLMQAHAGLQSYTARLKHVENVPLTGTDFMASDVDGTVEWMRKGEAILYRMEIRGTSTQKFGPNESKAEQTSTFVSDGKMFYTFAEQMGQKRFIKQKADNSIIGDIRSVLDTVRVENNFKLAADDKVDGAECSVIEVTPKVPPSDDNPIHTTLIYFRKDNGLNVRVLSRNKAGKDIYDNTILDLITNVPIDASRFVLPPPPGVEITDLTGIDDPPKPPATETKEPQKP
jgi:outer membrane lipoprotein-sorting protein